MAKRCAYFGCLLALALICGYVELLVPINLGLPGIKLGLANIVAVWLLYKNGFFEAFAVNTARILLSGILFGNAMSVFYSLCGGVLSLLSMVAVKRFKCFSAVGVSVVGGVAHNIGQLLAALTVISYKAIIYYFPWLVIVGVITGIIVGIIALFLIKRVKI